MILTKAQIKKQGVSEIENGFIHLAIDHVSTFFTDNTKASNRKVELLTAMFQELRKRGVPGAQAIERLASHSDSRVRYCISTGYIEIEPQKGLALLKDLSIDPNRLIAARAKGALDYFKTIYLDSH